MKFSSFDEKAGGYVLRAANKPDNIIEKCHRFIQSLSDEDCWLW
jgi:hypothetical protein